VRCGGASPGKDEGGQLAEAVVEGVDLPLEALDLRIEDAQGAVLRRSGRRGEVGAEVEELVLQPGQEGVEAGPRRVQAGEAQAGVGLVHVAVGGHAQVGL